MGILGIREDISMELFDQGVITDNTGAIQYNLMQQDMVALQGDGALRLRHAEPGEPSEQHVGDQMRIRRGAAEGRDWR